MQTEEEKKQKRAELLKKLHSKVNGKQASRMNKQFKNKKMEEIKEQMTQGNPDMKENVDKMIKKLKKNNKVKHNMPKTLEEKVKDLEKEFITK
tara:strand:- start:362 stop:640 length:279 start_codon:yes stop_codon:yes gene_type:complete